MLKDNGTGLGHATRIWIPVSSPESPLWCCYWPRGEVSTSVQRLAWRLTQTCLESYDAATKRTEAFRTDAVLENLALILETFVFVSFNATIPGALRRQMQPFPHNSIWPFSKPTPLEQNSQQPCRHIFFKFCLFRKLHFSQKTQQTILNCAGGSVACKRRSCFPNSRRLC